LTKLKPTRLISRTVLDKGSQHVHVLNHVFNFDPKIHLFTCMICAYTISLLKPFG